MAGAAAQKCVTHIRLVVFLLRIHNMKDEVIHELLRGKRTEQNASM